MADRKISIKKNTTNLNVGLSDGERRNAPSKRATRAVAYTPGTRMGIRTWRSAIADLKGPLPGAPSGALGESTPGWVWPCDAAISHYH